MKNKQETKQEAKKKALPVMKRLARELSVDEVKAVAGGFTMGTGPSSRDNDVGGIFN